MRPLEGKPRHTLTLSLERRSRIRRGLEKSTLRRAGGWRSEVNTPLARTATSSAGTIQLEKWLALTRTLSPGRGNSLLPRREQSLNRGTGPALEKVLPLHGERAGVREVVAFNCIETDKSGSEWQDKASAD